MLKKCLILMMFSLVSALAWAQRMPQGLLDDMIATVEQTQLPSAVVAFDKEDYDLDEQGQRQLASVAAMMERHGDASFYLVAAYDDERLPARHAAKLCQRRCQAVRDALVKRYGVDARRIVMLPDGGFAQEHAQHGRRMVLAVMRTPDTEAVVQRWVMTY